MRRRDVAQILAGRPAGYMTQRSLQDLEWHLLVSESSRMRVAQAMRVYALRDAGLTRKKWEECTDVCGLKRATL